MEEPKISPAFTIEDIHKIREWNYERSKVLTADEIAKERKAAATWFASEMGKRKAVADERRIL
jgi:hypothetical protein